MFYLELKPQWFEFLPNSDGAPPPEWSKSSLGSRPPPLAPREPPRPERDRGCLIGATIQRRDQGDREAHPDNALLNQSDHQPTLRTGRHQLDREVPPVGKHSVC